MQIGKSSEFRVNHPLENAKLPVQCRLSLKVLNQRMTEDPQSLALFWSLYEHTGMCHQHTLFYHRHRNTHIYTNIHTEAHAHTAQINIFSQTHTIERQIDMCRHTHSFSCIHIHIHRYSLAHIHSHTTIYTHLKKIQSGTTK